MTDTQTPRQAGPDRDAGRRTPAPQRRAQALAAGLAALGALVVLLVVAGGAPQPVPAGLPDPGPFVGWALPVLDLAGQVLAVVVLSALLVPLLTMTTLRDVVGRGGALAVVAPAAGLWALVTLAQVVLTYADQAAVPLSRLDAGGLGDALGYSTQAQALVVQAVLALVVSLAATRLRAAGGAAWLAAATLVAVVPPLLTGHAASSGGAGGHGLGEISLVIHVLGASVWAGGVVALWWHLAGDPDRRALAARRFSALAAWCFGVVAVSGALTGLARLGTPGDLVSPYGGGVVTKVVVLGAVGLVAIRLRRIVRSAGSPGADWARVSGLTAIEVTLMAAAFGLGAALSRTPTPAGVLQSPAELLVGGPLPPDPTLGRLLWTWQLSGVGLMVVLLGGTAYAVGVLRLRRRGDRWSPWRTASFALGLFFVLYATSGGLGVYAEVLFSVHMVAHMMLAMLAPMFIVLGAPTTLALRALPGADVPGGTGPRQLLSAALRSRVAGVVTHPVVVGLLFVGSLYVVYLGGLFDVLMDHHLGHAAMELHFLASGLLFFEIIVGDSPVRRLPHIARVGLLMVTIAFHAFFAVAVMATETVIGARYYATLGYADDPLTDQYLAGSATWALGEVPMVLLIVVVLLQWWRDDSREARRRDRSGNADAEMAAYNEMLARRSAADRAAADRG